MLHEPLDVLIVTAVPEEYAAVLAVETGAAPGSAWDDRDGVAVRTFRSAGGALTVGVTQARAMGGVEAAVAVDGALLKERQVRCLAMCGLCAGKSGDVALGDVIVADRVWQYDTGKGEQGDIEMFRLHPPEWKQAAERFKLAPDEQGWLASRPRSLESQGDWILERVLHGADPVADVESTAMCRDFDKALARLWKKELEPREAA